MLSLVFHGWKPRGYLTFSLWCFWKQSAQITWHLTDKPETSKPAWEWLWISWEGLWPRVWLCAALCLPHNLLQQVIPSEDKVEADASRCLWAGLSGSKLIYSWGWRMGIEFLASQTAQHFQEGRSQDVSPGCHFNFHGNQTNEAEHTCTILQSRLLPHSCSVFAQASKYLLLFVFIYLEKATFPPKVIHASWLRAELTRSVLPPLSVLIILLGWWQGPLLKQLIFFSDTAVSVFGIRNVKGVEFYIS